MTSDIIFMLTGTFEGHAQQTEGGVEFWLARDLQHLLGYAKWDNFLKIAGQSRGLFKGPYLAIPGPSYAYDATNDRFLLVARQDDAPQTEIRVVLNWFQELERLAPAGRD